MKGVPPIEQHPLQIRQRPVQKAQSQKKHCHRRTTEHEPNRVANGSSSVDWRAVFPPIIDAISGTPRRAIEAPGFAYIRTLQLKSCFPPIISGMPRQTKAPGTSYSALFRLQRYNKILRPPRIKDKKEHSKENPVFVSLLWKVNYFGSGPRSLLITQT